jgi:hypothetical protein
MPKRLYSRLRRVIQKSKDRAQRRAVVAPSSENILDPFANNGSQHGTNGSRGAGPISLALISELRSLRGKPLHSLSNGSFSGEIRSAGKALWLVARWGDGLRMAFCLAWTAGEKSQVVECAGERGSFRCGLQTLLGRYDVAVETCGRSGVFHWRSTLKPAAKMTVPYWPCDTYPLDAKGNPLATRGVVHTRQQGTRGAFLYGSVTEPESGSFLYVQNLTALNPYFAKTHTSPCDCVSDCWPELGFALPRSPEKALEAGEEMVVSDAYVACAEGTPGSERQASRQFIDLYGRLYLELPKPEARHRDWPRRVDETIHDLTHSPKCCVERHGHRYLLAYTGADDRPPESMVQLAVLIPLLEYSRMREQHIPLVDELAANIGSFYHPGIESIARWLPADSDTLRGQEEQMKENVMDSWYLYHAYLNLARLASFGYAEARKLFLESVEYGIRVAQHFEYRWPVFYDIYTLRVIKPETEPGRGGEFDVGAQYVHVMQQAWEMTGEGRFIEEAERAAQRLTGIGFELGYQLNNTSFGAGGLIWLYQQTKKELYLELSEVCMANIVQNFWLWECDYGHARHYHTYMGLPPLREAPYLATYEELELLAAFHEYLERGGNDVRPGLRVLLPEYCKYLIDRAWYHYPSELPKDVLAAKPKSGILDRYISMPVEDLYEGWQNAGQVGQQVYGAAAPFVFSTRHCHYIKGSNFHVACNYPVKDFEVKRRHAAFSIAGDARCKCAVRIVPSEYTRLPAVRGYVKNKRVKGTVTAYGYIEFEVRGDADFRLEWEEDARHGGSAAGRRAKG